jgi:peroxiredoxin Q/BCP
VLYFYPRASTPGCTTEACEFRDAHKKLSKFNAVIIGISPDAPVAQSKFKSKFELPFTLLCDVDKTTAQAYGVWKEKNMYGRKVRASSALRPDRQDGKIKMIFEGEAQGRAEVLAGAVGALGFSGKPVSHRLAPHYRNDC